MLRQVHAGGHTEFHGQHLKQIALQSHARCAFAMHRLMRCSNSVCMQEHADLSLVVSGSGVACEDRSHGQNSWASGILQDSLLRGVP